MEIRIGIKHTARELSFDTDASPDEVRSAINTAVDSDQPFFTLTDTKNREYVVNTESVAYLEFGGDTGRKVGFVS